MNINTQDKDNYLLSTNISENKYTQSYFIISEVSDGLFLCLFTKSVFISPAFL